MKNNQVKSNHGGVRPGAGRKAGSPNKITADIKAMILGALEEAGGQAWLRKQMDQNPVAYMALLGKILPHQLNGDDGEPLTIVRFRWMTQEEAYEATPTKS